MSDIKKVDVRDFDKNLEQYTSENEHLALTENDKIVAYYTKNFDNSPQEIEEAWSEVASFSGCIENY